MEYRALAVIAALTLALGVAAGAFGAHGLRQVLTPQMMQIWQTAVLYQLVHGLGMLALVALGTRLPGPLWGYAGWLLFAGVLLFSGSLYLLAGTGIRWLGAITPLGGVAFILGWLLLALAAYRAR